MQETRQHILVYLCVHPDATFRNLRELLTLTTTGVRQHLTLLEQDGLIESREQRGKVGRPALVYSLTAAGEASYPLVYDLLSNAMLDEVHASYGADGFQQMIRGVAK